MKLTIKIKLLLGIGLLFLLIVFLAVYSALRVESLASETKNILADNYKTLEYSRVMLKSLDEERSLTAFEKTLRLQEANITEPGEREVTGNLRKHLEILLDRPDSVNVKREMRNDLNLLMKLNMDAIERKSISAAESANDTSTMVKLMGALCFMVALILLFNLPSYIANPIKELTNSIKEIAAKNYSQRVHFGRNDEFGDLAESFNTMAQKLQEYANSNLAKLMIEKRRIETLIDNMHDPVIVLDENKRIIFANEEALKITGLKRDEAIGKLSQELSVVNDLMRSLMQSFVQVQEHRSGPVKIYADGKESYFEKEIINISIVPTGEQEKKLIGHVIILRNVTSYKELDFAKTNFIATVSHEFKTPISSIKMSLELLENEQVGKVNEEQKYLLNSIKEDANRLLKITGELLNMTQVESGNIQLNLIPSSPVEIVHFAVAANRIAAEQKHVKIEVSCPNDIPKVLADSEKTAWVLTNLISNAIRYSYDDSTVFVKVISANGHIRFSVKDTGQGIAPQYKDKIFDRYFRVPGTKKEGTGLGLAISKEFIEAQGGKISVETDFGAGSEFMVELKTET